MSVKNRKSPANALATMNVLKLRTSMHTTIRRINRQEAALVTGLFNSYRVFYRQPSDPELANDFIQARLDNHESVIFLATVKEEDQDIPAGFTQLYPCYSSVRAVRNWILNDLYVEPAFRNRQIGRALIRTAREFAISQGARFLELSTATDNYVAQGLYERTGFIKQSPDTEFYTYRLFLDK